MKEQVKDRAAEKKRGLIMVMVMTLLFAAVISIGGMAGKQMQTDLEARRTESVKEAVLSAALQCYAIEGAYPSGLDYLEEHYGVMVNHGRYIVSYDCFAENEPPEVMVLPR